MNHHKNTKSSNKISILGFGPIRLPIYDNVQTTKKQAVKYNKSKLDLLCSAQAVVKKLQKIIHQE